MTPSLPELTLYAMSLLCLISGIALLVRAKRGKRRRPFLHQDADVLQKWAWDDAKAREHDRRDF